MSEGRREKGNDDMQTMCFKGETDADSRVNRVDGGCKRWWCGLRRTGPSRLSTGGFELETRPNQTAERTPEWRIWHTV